MKVERVWPVPGGFLRVEIESDSAKGLADAVTPCLREIVTGEWRKSAEGLRGQKREKDCGCSGS